MKKLITMIFLLTLSTASADSIYIELTAEEKARLQRIYRYTINSTIKSVELVDGRLEVVITEYEQDTQLLYCPNGCPQRAHTARKEIYTAYEGRVVLLETIFGKYYPEGYSRSPERFEWE